LRTTPTNKHSRLDHVCDGTLVPARTLGRHIPARQEANWRGRGDDVSTPRAASHFSAPCSSVYINDATCELRPMIELVRTNDAVIISFVESLMRDAGIACFVADQNMSILEGSIGLLQKRVMVDADQADQARRILKDAGIENEIRQK